MKRRLICFLLTALLLSSPAASFAAPLSGVTAEEAEDQVELIRSYESQFQPQNGESAPAAIPAPVPEAGSQETALPTVCVNTIGTGSVTSHDPEEMEALGLATAVTRYADGSTDLDGAYNAIFTGLYDLSESIPLYDYQLTQTQLHTIFQNIADQCPEIFYCHSYTPWVSGSTITRMVPVYDDPDTVPARRAALENAVDEIVAMMDPAWSEIEKTLFLSDYFALNYDYDYAGIAHGDPISDALGFLTEKTGVCQAYTLAAIAVLKACGMTVSSFSSTPMNHIWNAVKVGNNWYHVDITYNDSWNNPRWKNGSYENTAYFGRVSHEFLFLSDAAILAETDPQKQHYDWVVSHTCTDTTYDNYFWRNIDFPIVEAAGGWYTVDNTNGALLSCDLKNGTTSVVKSFATDRWNVWNGGGYWVGCFAGIASYNDIVYYNGPTTFRTYDPAAGTFGTLSVEWPSSNGYLYGLQGNGRTLSYPVSTEPQNKAQPVYTYLLPEPENGGVYATFRVFNDSVSDCTATLRRGGTVKATGTVTLKSGDASVGYLMEASFDGVPTGLYDLVIEKPAHLTAVVENVAVSGSALTDLDSTVGTVILPAGDINGDNFIDSTDITRLSFDMGRSDANASDPNTDLNGDGYRDSLDVSVLSFYLLATPPTVTLD